MAHILFEYLTSNFILLVMLIGMRLILTSNSDIGKKATGYMRGIIWVVFLLSLFDQAELYFAGYPTYNIERVVVNWVGYTLRPIACMLFLRITTYTKKFGFAVWVPIILNSAIFATSMFGLPIAYTFDEKNNFVRGPLGFTAHIVTLIYIIVIVVIAIRDFRQKKKNNSMAILLCALVVIIATAVETLYTGIHIVNLSIIISCIFYYLYLHIFTTTSANEEKEELLSDQRAAMKLSQVRPRFIYETLESYRDLILTNPPAAQAATDCLITFLRANFETTDMTTPIPFSVELELTQNYVAIELVKNRNLKVKYEIESGDFEIPALTLQQIVENAIRHGLKDVEYGEVNIKVFGSDTGHTIIVQDNGKGFKGDDELQDIQGAHFGIANVRDRLKRMVGGDLTFVTLPSAGTTAMISVPNED